MSAAPGRPKQARTAVRSTEVSDCAAPGRPKQARTAVRSTKVSECAAPPQPGSAENFTVQTVTTQDVAVWYHVYSRQSHPSTDAFTFNQGWGESRFAPVYLANGAPVHTYYVASNAESAYMESILHDVSLAPPGLFEHASLDHHHLVKLRLTSSIEYTSFHTPFLPQLQDMTRAQLIDSSPKHYAQTRAWAQAAYEQCPTAQAVGYGSRRHDSGRCLMLFKQRLPDPPFQVISEEPLAIGTRRAEVLALVRSLKLREV